MIIMGIYIQADILSANNIKLQQRFHNVEGKLWKRCQVTLLQRNPGKLRERCRKKLYENISTTLWQHSFLTENSTCIFIHLLRELQFYDLYFPYIYIFPFIPSVSVVQ